MNRDGKRSQRLERRIDKLFRTNSRGERVFRLPTFLSARIYETVIRSPKEEHAIREAVSKLFSPLWGIVLPLCIIFPGFFLASNAPALVLDRGTRLVGLFGAASAVIIFVTVLYESFIVLWYRRITGNLKSRDNPYFWLFFAVLSFYFFLVALIAFLFSNDQQLIKPGYLFLLLSLTFLLIMRLLRQRRLRRRQGIDESAEAEPPAQT
jgi:hypothetical protein